MSGTWNDRLKRCANVIWSIVRPLLNATLILVIVAGVTGLALMNSTRSLVNDTMAEVKSGVLREIDEDARHILGEIEAADAEYERLKRQVTDLLNDPQALLDGQAKKEIRSIRDDLARIADDLDRISAGQIEISQNTLERLAVSLVRTYGEIRGCKTGEALEPDHATAPRT